MGMNQPPPFIPFPGTPFPRHAPLADPGPGPGPSYPFQNTQASDPSRVVQLPNQQPEPLSNQPQFPVNMDPYSQGVGLQQMQQPPQAQVILSQYLLCAYYSVPTIVMLTRSLVFFFCKNQTTSQLSFGQASSSKEPEDQENQPTGW